MRRRFVLLLLGIVTLNTGACSKSAPKCDEKSTKGIVFDIASKRFVSDESVNHTFDLVNIVNDGTDKETGKCKCQGELEHTLKFSDPNNPIAKQLDWMSKNNTEAKGVAFVKVDDNTFIITHIISYTSSLTTDGKQYVSVISGLE